MALRATGAPGARFAIVAALAALGLFALAIAVAPITNNDIWLHLATGRWILAEGRVPDREPFSFVAAGRPYVAHEWGAALLFILLERSAGLAGLILFKAAAGLGLAWGLWTWAIRRGAAAWSAGMAAAAALFIAGTHFWERPHLFSWGFTLVVPATLFHARRRPRLLLVLPAAQILWTNLHGGFVLGPVLALLWSLGELVRRRQGATDARPGLIAITSLGMAAACLVNPYGLALLRLPFELTGSELFMQAVYEWQPPLTSGYLQTPACLAFLLLVGLLIGAGFRRRRTLDPCDLLLVAALLALALRMNRAVPQFALLGAPLLAVLAAPERPGRPAVRGPLLLAAALLTAAIPLALAGYPLTWNVLRPLGTGPGPAVPVAACDYLASQGITGRAFTTYGEGAYVVWRLWPGVQVGMDSRNSVYGEALYAEYRAALRTDAGTRAWDERYQADLAVVGHRGPFSRGLETEFDRDDDLPHREFLASGHFALVEFDDLTAVYLRDQPAHAALIASDAYRVIHPVLLPPVFPPVDLPRAALEAERAVTRHPDSVLSRWIMANVLAQSRQPDRALEQLAILAALGNRIPAAWGVGHRFEVSRLGLVGLLELQRGRTEAARRALDRALALDPGFRPALELRRRLSE